MDQRKSKAISDLIVAQQGSGGTVWHTPAKYTRTAKESIDNRDEIGQTKIRDAAIVTRGCKCIWLSRAITTSLTLPNGVVTYPSATIPPMSIKRVALAHKNLAETVSTLSDGTLLKITADYMFDVPDSPDREKRKGIDMTAIRAL
ncbi:hypothetical protein N0V85_004196 [Neurospora sp. IMI 360204]|nr:hypothetical protein N0V85_004196 [Neurospora sp. IMI 360204]